MYGTIECEFYIDNKWIDFKSTYNGNFFIKEGDKKQIRVKKAEFAKRFNECLTKSINK